jgi:Nucleotide modification associated domain 3
MRLIFSRKGFDSASGGCASPLVDGCPIPLPIPTRQPTATTFGSIGGNMADFANDLTSGRITKSTPCHLDPDLDAMELRRATHWRSALGQVGTAQGHLWKQSVQMGDLFLFWGFFRPALRRENDLRWMFNGAREHRIFGWLQVGDILAVGADPRAALKKYP